MSFIKIKDPRKREELMKDLIETRKRIKDNFIAKKVGEIEYQRGLTKLFKPVTETQKATAKEITEAEDLKDYIYIMHITNTTRAKHEKSGKRIGGNNKMENLIKPLVIAYEEGGEDKLIKKISEYLGFKEETDEETDEETYEEEYIQPSTSGTGLTILPSDPNALIDRFDLLFSSQNAGHTGVRNEIISILDELKRQGVINTKEYKKLNHLIKK